MILKSEGYVADGEPVPLRKRKAKTWSGKNSQTIVETAPLIQQSSFRKYHHWRLGVGSIYKTKQKIQNKIWAIKGGQIPCIATRIMNVKKVMYFRGSQTPFLTNISNAIESRCGYFPVFEQYTSRKIKNALKTGFKNFQHFFKD